MRSRSCEPVNRQHDNYVLMCFGCRGQRSPDIPAFVIPGGVSSPRVKPAGEKAGVFTRELADVVKATLKSVGEKRGIRLVAWAATPGFALALLECQYPLGNLHQVLSQTASRRAVEAGLWPKHCRLLSSRVRECRVEFAEQESIAVRLKAIGWRG